jgi:hypothetical protein
LLGWVGLIQKKDWDESVEGFEGRVIQGDGLGVVSLGWIAFLEDGREANQI